MKRNVDDRQLAVARVYADSLLALAEEAGQGDETLDELDGIVALQERDPDLAAFFASPLVDEQARRRTVEKSLRGEVSDLVVNTLQVMNNKGRLDLLPALAAAYREALDALRGRVDVSITSAVPLSDGLREELLGTLRRVTGREVRLDETVDADLLGGIVVSLGDRKIDYSLATDLRQLDDQLRDRASREIHGAAL